MTKKQRIVHGQGASKVDFSTVVFIFDVCRLSQPISSTIYVLNEQARSVKNILYGQDNFFLQGQSGKSWAGKLGPFRVVNQNLGFA